MSLGFPSMDCQIQANPDVAGIGVRVSIYFQALFAIFSVVIRLYALEQGDDGISHEELIRSTFYGSMTIIFTGLAIAVSGVIQAVTYGLSVYHAMLMLDLCWVIIIGALVPFFVIVVGGTNTYSLHVDYLWRTKCGLTGFDKLDLNHRVASRLHFLHSLHFTITSCVGMWVFTRLAAFDTSPDNCTLSTVGVVAGHEHVVTSPFYHVFSLVLYSMFALPILNVFLAQVFLLYLPMFITFEALWWCEQNLPISFNKHDLTFPLSLASPLMVLILIITSTEQTIKANNVTVGEGQWTLGQTLALMAAFISTIDFDAWLWQKFARRMGWDSDSKIWSKMAAMDREDLIRVQKLALESEMEEERRQRREAIDASRWVPGLRRKTEEMWKSHCKRRGIREPIQF